MRRIPLRVGSGRQKWHYQLMKHNQLCAIAHNVADSMVSGAFIIGHYPLDVFGEAASNAEGVIVIDYLTGRITRGSASLELCEAALLFAEALPSFCNQHGADVKDFETLSVTFEGRSKARRVLLSVTDRTGRSSMTEYAGTPLKRIRVLDRLGRVRRIPRKH